MVFCYIENGLDNGFHVGRPGVSSLALALHLVHLSRLAPLSSVACLPSIQVEGWDA